MSLDIKGIVKNGMAVTFTGGEFINPIETSSYVYCRVDGTVQVELSNGFNTSQAMLAGSYWRVGASKIIEAGTSATVEIHW